MPANPVPPDAALTSSAATAGSGPPGPPEWPQPFLSGGDRGLLRLDRLGLSQCIAGLNLGLIALFSSYDHITIAGYRIPLQQPWGIVCIAVSLAAVVVVAVGFCEAVAELATRSRLRAAHDAAHAADVAAGRRSRSSSRARSSRSGARQSRSGATAIGSGKKSSSDGARTPGSLRGTPKAEPC